MALFKSALTKEVNKKEDRFNSLINRLMELEEDTNIQSSDTEQEFDLSDAIKMRDALRLSTGQSLEQVSFGKKSYFGSFSFEDKDLSQKIFNYAKSLLISKDGRFNPYMPIKLEPLNQEEDLNFTQRLQNLLFEEGLSKEQIDKLVLLLKPEFSGFGPLQKLYLDPNTTAVLINSFNQIYIESNGKLVLTNISFFNQDHYTFTIQKLLKNLKNDNVDEKALIVEGVLNDGSKLYVFNEKSSTKEPVVIIRKTSKINLSLKNLVASGMITEKAVEFLKNSIKNKQPIWICGPSRSGKTTLLNALANSSLKEERLVSVEKNSELKLIDLHWVPFYLNEEETITKILASIHKLRADKIIFNDFEVSELNKLVDVINTGDESFLVSLNLKNAQMLLNYILFAYDNSGVNTNSLLKENIAGAIPIIVECGFDTNKKPKVMHIRTVTGVTKDGNFVFENK